MSFSSREKIAYGDVVILYTAPSDPLQAITIEPEGVLHSRFGNFPHSTFEGQPFGSRIAQARGFIYALRPTPKLWTLALPHRTQIVYHADISLIMLYLCLRPGMRVIEAGTGSGSLTHSFAKVVGPTGALFSFEYHQQRFETAKLEFEGHGICPPVQLRHRDVCRLHQNASPFHPASEIEAVFLDLPSPWLAIAYLTESLSQDRLSRICCFSPCIEQVTKTVSTLGTHGWSDIEMVEVHERPRMHFHGSKVKIKTVEEVCELIERQGKIRQAQEPTKKEEPQKRKLEGRGPLTYSLPARSQKGHTSWLTFAVHIPRAYRRHE